MLGYQVTLTTAATAYNLLTLVRAIDPAYVDGGDISIEVEDDGGTQKILLGDANISTTRYGWKGTIGDNSPHFSTLGNLWAQSDTSAKKLNISIRRGRP